MRRLRSFGRPHVERSPSEDGRWSSAATRRGTDAGVTLSHRKLQEREGRWLKMLSGVVILVLGVTMIFKPEWMQLGQ